ncbi:hypothetical protein MNBD_ALPHA09-1310 [hydrothermal vent metagenome]|uniref:Uncharacterized protein n=1 Tax=hydrothermal vent metagenome TaxID=652676 RepID=A0A3B0TAK1_9ZZZZ
MSLSALNAIASQGLQSTLKSQQISPLTGKPRIAPPLDFSAEIFSATLPNQADQNALTLKAMERDIKRLQGLKVDITPADAKQLAKLQDEIQRIEARAGPEGLSTSEIEDRAEAYRGAFKILGKEFVDLEKDDTLKNLSKAVDKLLEPPLLGEKKQRLERLRRLSNNLEVAFIGGNRSTTLMTQLVNVQKQISDLVPPRLISELSPTDKRAYDLLVEKVNERAGVEMILPANKRERIEKIQAAMAQLGG